MKIVKPEARRIVGRSPLEVIELAARNCYKSEDKIDKGTDVKMFNFLLGKNHTAMLEHGAMIFESPTKYSKSMGIILKAILANRYITISENKERKMYRFSGNIRALLNLHILEVSRCVADGLGLDITTLAPEDKPKTNISSRDFQDMFYPIRFSDLATLGTFEERMMHGRMTLKLTCDRGITHELVRHRVFSFAQSSTRYCNYSTGKFGSEITVVKPFFFDGLNDSNAMRWKLWEKSCEDAEQSYMALLKAGATPQEARSVLPNSLMSEIIMTGRFSDWVHFFDLRYFGHDGAPHPQMKELTTIALPIWKETLDEYRIRPIIVGSKDAHGDIEHDIFYELFE